MAFTIPANVFLRQQQPRPTSQTTPEDAVVDGVFDTSGLRAGVQGVAPATATDPVEQMPDVLQNERSTFGAILEALATAADPGRAQRRAKEQREVTAQNRQIDLQNKQVELQENQAAADRLMRQQELMITLAGMDQANARDIANHFLAFGVDPADLSETQREAFRKQFGEGVWGMVEAIGEVGAQTRQLRDAATVAQTEDIQAGTKLKHAQEAATRAQTALVPIQAELLQAEANIKTAEAGVIDEQLQLNLDMMHEQLRGLGITNDTNVIRKRIANAERIMADIRAGRYGEELQLIFDKMQAEIDKYNAEVSRISDNSANVLEINARLDRGKQSFEAGQAALGELMGSYTPDNPDSRTVLEAEARALMQSLRTEMDPAQYAQRGDEQAAKDVERFLDNAAKDLETQLRSKGYPVNLTKASRMAATEERFTTAVPDRNRRAAMVKATVTESAGPDDLSQAEYEEIEYVMRDNYGIDTDAAAAYLYTIDTLQASQYIKDIVFAKGTNNPYNIVFDEEAMRANGMNDGSIKQYKERVGAELEAVRGGQGELNKIGNRLGGMGMARPNWSRAQRRMLMAPTRPLSVNTIRDMNVFINDLTSFENNSRDRAGISGMR